jgi:glycosyltransferase involved in cell wall biosynthesis
VQPLGHYPGHYSVYTEKLTKSFIKAGVEVHLATFSGFTEQWIENLPVQHKSFLSPTSKCKALFIYLRRFKKIVPLVAAFESLLTFFAVVAANRSNSYDVIHVIDYYYPIFYFSFAFTRGNVLLLNLNNVFTATQDGKSGWRKRIKRFFKEILTRQIKRKNILSFICHSRHVEESYSKMPIYRPITTIPWGIDNLDIIISKTDARKYLDLPQDRTIFLIFGPNHHFKNLKTIFQAVEKMERDFIFIYAGKINRTDENNDPWRLSKKYDWFENTLIIDRYIPESEIPYYFYSADALILSYKKDFLGASGVLSYACQFSLPVIAAEVGQMGEFVRKYNLGVVFRPENPESLSEAIRDFIRLQERQKEKFRDNMKNFILKNSWDSVGQQHLDFYKIGINLKAKR